MDKNQEIFSLNSFLKSYEEVKNINTLNLGQKYSILGIKLKNRPHEKDYGIFLLGNENTPPQKIWIPIHVIKYCFDANINLKNLSEFGTVFLKANQIDRIDHEKFVTHFTFGIDPEPPKWITKYLDSITKFNEMYKTNKMRHKEAIQKYAKICKNIADEPDLNMNMNEYPSKVSIMMKIHLNH